jgi:hypothetical protein
MKTLKKKKQKTGANYVLILVLNSDRKNLIEAVL